jgi:hypothetical protein
MARQSVQGRDRGRGNRNSRVVGVVATTASHPADVVGETVPWTGRQEGGGDVRVVMAAILHLAAGRAHLIGAGGTSAAPAR